MLHELIKPETVSAYVGVEIDQRPVDDTEILFLYLLLYLLLYYFCTSYCLCIDGLGAAVPACCNTHQHYLPSKIRI